MEQDILNLMKKETDDAQKAELAATECVIAMIQDHIEECEPIRELWLMAPNAVAVCPSKHVLPAMPLIPTPAVVASYEDRLNDGQLQEVLRCLSGLQASDSILNEDFVAWVSSMCDSSVAPQRNSRSAQHHEGAVPHELKQCMLPLSWRTRVAELRSALSRIERLPEIAETIGIVDVDQALSRLLAAGEQLSSS